MARYVSIATFAGPHNWLSHKRVSAGLKGIWILQVPPLAVRRPGGTWVAAVPSLAPSRSSSPVVAQNAERIYSVPIGVVLPPAGVMAGEQAAATIISIDPATIRRSRV